MHKTHARRLVMLALLMFILVTSACRLTSWRDAPAPLPITPTPTPLPTTAPLGGLFGLPTGETLQPPATQVSYQLDPTVNRASNAFGLDLLRTLANPDELQNMMISPISLMMALGMTANGSLGETQAEILAALRLKELDMLQVNQGLAGLQQAYADPALPATLAIANALWLAEGTSFHEAYVLDVARYYDAEVTTLPMNNATVERINGWVYDNTLGEIDTILAPPLSANTVLILTNAIYFKGTWRAPFEPERTKPRPFRTLGGDQVETPTMEQTGRFGLWHGQEYRVLALPYGDSGNLQMYIMLPNAQHGLPELLAGLTSDDLLRISQDLAIQEVDVALPKFESEYEATLNDALQAMGMCRAFDDQADLSAMSPRGSQFYISKVKHKSTITVDEKGTVAAAASAVVVAEKAETKRQIFVVDHPFLYGIWDGNTKTLLFVGIMVVP